MVLWLICSPLSEQKKGAARLDNKFLDDAAAGHQSISLRDCCRALPTQRGGRPPEAPGISTVLPRGEAFVVIDAGKALAPKPFDAAALSLVEPGRWDNQSLCPAAALVEARLRCK